MGFQKAFLRFLTWIAGHQAEPGDSLSFKEGDLEVHLYWKGGGVRRIEYRGSSGD